MIYKTEVIMKIERKEYQEYVKSHAKRSPMLKNAVLAFLIGGFICTFGQLLFALYSLFADEEAAKTLSTVTLIFLTALLTGIGVFDEIAKNAGAGTLVPITGFANAVVSPAIDNKAEGTVLGIGSKMFIVAGPVIVYGTLASAIWGVVYYLINYCF